MFGERRIEKAFLFLLLAVALGKNIYSGMTGIHNFYALTGQSPIEWTYFREVPKVSELDFKSSTANYDRSLVMHIYPMAKSLFGVSPESLVPWMVAIEFLLNVVAFWILSQALTNTPVLKGGWLVPVIVSLIVTASSFRDGDLARFGYPQMGLYYNFLDAFRIGALVFALRQSYFWLYVLVALAMLTHPPLAVMGVIAVSAILVAQRAWRDPLKKHVAGMVVAGLLLALWGINFYQGAELDAGGISKDLWFAFSKLCSYHWFSFAYSHWNSSIRSVVFYEGRLLSFISFGLLIAFYSRHFLRRDWRPGIAAAMLAAMAMIAIGLLAARLEWSPLVAKVAFHRASDLIMILGLPIVVAGLLFEIAEGGSVRGILSLLLLLSPFLGNAAFPLGITTALMTIHWLNPASGKTEKWFAWTSLAGSAFLYFAARREGLYLLTDVSFLGAYASMKKVVFILAFFFAVVWRLPEFRLANLLRPILLSCTAAVLTYAALVRPLPWVPKGTEENYARDYRAVQEWAKANTSETALFSPDPSLSYGWRTFSRRASFGCAREWMYVSWIYDSKKSVFDEGMRRLSEFNIDMNRYLHRYPPFSGHDDLIFEVRDKFYSLGDEWRLGLARKYGIDYFVLDNAHYQSNSQLPLVFANAHFSVLDARSMLALPERTASR